MVALALPDSLSSDTQGFVEAPLYGDSKRWALVFTTISSTECMGLKIPLSTVSGPSEHQPFILEPSRILVTSSANTRMLISEISEISDVLYQETEG